MSAEVQTEIAAGRELSRAFKRQSASRSDLMIPFHDKKTNTAAAETSDATINPPLETTKGTDRMLAVASAEPEIDRSISHVVGHQERPSSQAVAINDQGKRVDVPLPDDAEVDDYALHRLAVKQCFNYHLSGSCKNFDCANSHDPVNEGVRNALIKLAHRFPCNNGRACRHSACFWGHTCLDAGYESGKKAWKCKLGPAMHKRLEITSFVKV